MVHFKRDKNSNRVPIDASNTSHAPQSFTTLPTEPPQHVYSRLLLRKGQGQPLWRPSPNADPSMPREIYVKGFGIGDVGTATSDGSFDFLFNILHGRDHPINSLGVPECFEQVHLVPGERSFEPRHYCQGSDVVSSNIHKQQQVQRSVINLYKINKSSN